MRRPPRPFCHRQPYANPILLAAVMAAVAASLSAQVQFTELPTKQLPANNGWTTAVALGDIDRDGDLDLVAGNKNASGTPGRQNRVYLNDSTGSFTDVTAAQMPVDNDASNCVALGDVDGDGDLDLLIGNGGQNRLYLNGGAGFFSDATANQMPTDNDATESIALGDIDADGDLDLVVGNNLGQNRLYVNNGTGTFVDSTASQMPMDSDSTAAVALGDLDRDGDLDLIIANGGSCAFGSCYGQQSRLYLNDGTGTFTDATATRMPAETDITAAVALGDVDGDGGLDLVLGNHGGCGIPGGWCVGQQNRLFLNDGAGVFFDATATHLPPDAHGTEDLALGDFDNDGDLDLVLCNSLSFPVPGQNIRTGGQNRLYLNNGTGIFNDVTATRFPPNTDDGFAVAAGDVDGDDDLDLVFGTYYVYRPNHVDFNVQRQLHAPAAPQLSLPYHLDAYLRYGPPSSVDLAAIYVSTGPASVPLPPFGTLGIDLGQAVGVPTLVIPQPVGVGSGSVVIPNSAGLIGQTIYSQAVLIAAPNDVRLSNVVVDVIQ